jgi:hypothetical protein
VVVSEEYITFVDNERSRVLSVGIVKVSENVTLMRVSLVKSLGFNLISVFQLLVEGFQVVSRWAFLVCWILEAILYAIVPEGQIFRIDFSQFVGSSCCLVAGVSTELWKCHRRLGHLSFDLLSHLSGLDLV